MALRTVRNLLCFSKSLRNYSTTAPLVNLSVNEKTGVATATLQRPPVNSLNFELISELSKTLQDLEKGKCRGLILTSSAKTVFSGGLDITEMYKPNVDRFKQFWVALQDLWINLYGSSYPTVAAINGHVPAGGCLLALSCEYRIMVNNFTIGLNETQLGIVAPPWFIASMRNAIGSRQAELALTSGNLFKTDEALKIGLVDEVVDSKEVALERAETFLQRYAKIPPHARSLTKKALRGKDIEALVKTKDQELNHLVGFITSPQIQGALEKYLTALKQKQK